MSKKTALFATSLLLDHSRRCKVDGLANGLRTPTAVWMAPSWRNAW